MGQPGRVNGIVHRFADQLEYSAVLSDEPAWINFYRRLWPDLSMAIRIDCNSQYQKDGIDREILLPNGKRFRIDEKKRKKDYGDVLLEEWSVFYGDPDARNKVGWALDSTKRCDFIAYAIPVACKCYLLPFELLRQAFVVNRSGWSRSFGTCDAWNEGYVTRSIPIPWKTLQTELVRQMLRRFDAMALELPAPALNGSQLEFPWSPESA